MNEKYYPIIKYDFMLASGLHKCTTCNVYVPRGFFCHICAALRGVPLPSDFEFELPPVPVGQERLMRWFK